MQIIFSDVSQKLTAHVQLVPVHKAVLKFNDALLLIIHFFSIRLFCVTNGLLEAHIYIDSLTAR